MRRRPGGLCQLRRFYGLLGGCDRAWQRLKSWLMHFDGAKQRMAIMAGPNGQAVMRHFAEKAKARKAKDAAKTARRGDPVPGQVKLEEVEDDGTMPF